MNHEFLVSGECHIFSQSEAKTTLHFSDSNAHFMLILSVVDFLLPLQYSSVKFAQNYTVLSESETDTHQSRQCNHHSRCLVYHAHKLIRPIMCLKHDIVGLHCNAICDMCVWSKHW